MSKKSLRPGREEIKAQLKKRKEAQKELRRKQAERGQIPVTRATIANHTSSYQTVEEERLARNEAVIEQTKIFRAQFPTLLRQLSLIEDPRNPNKLKHKLTVLMLYGILSFVFQMASRREANREMTMPMFKENLKALFPDLESIPHHDTLMRLLSRIEVSELEKLHLELITRYIRNKKFKRYLVGNRYPIAIDGTQKFVRDTLWAEECLEREISKKDGAQSQYYVYVLEANLAFANGMSIPLMSEFLSYGDGVTISKQDCELVAFKRLAARLKKEFPRLPIIILLDGLYPNGPVMEICRHNNWQFMIVLQDKSLPSVWEEFNGLGKLQMGNKATLEWGGRDQRFKWVNDIVYYYGDNCKKSLTIHVVTCEESWQEIDKNTNRTITKTSRHAWISSVPLSKQNLHERCNLAARHRWAIESSFLVEKRHGYNYEHCLSYNWNAMKGYHYLMRMGHMFNVLTQYAECFVSLIKTLGSRGLVRFIRETIAAPWLDLKLIWQTFSQPYQLRLV